MRAVVVTQDDPFYISEFFKTFLAGIRPEVDVRRIYCLDPFDESFLALIHRMYRFYGPRNFVRRGTEFVARKFLDQVGMRNFSVRSIAGRYKITSEDIQTVNEPAFIDQINHEAIDVILSVSAPEIFEDELLNAPNWGCLNVHTAELPKYRGMLPTFWALYHDEDEIGVTVHTMAEEIDAGEIVNQVTFPVGDDDSLDDVILRGKRLGGELAAEALNEIAKGGDITTKPMENEGTYFSFPTVEERREFQRKGRRLL